MGMVLQICCIAVYLRVSIMVRTSQNTYISRERGYTVVEFMVAAVVFGILVTGLFNAYRSMLRSYTLARQMNEIYTVLSACPEIDRALEFTSLTSTTNCAPNNEFMVEDAPGGVISYSPTLTVTDSSALDGSDPLNAYADSKVVDVSVGLPQSPTVPAMELRLLITRNGIGQL